MPSPFRVLTQGTGGTIGPRIAAALAHMLIAMMLGGPGCSESPNEPAVADQFSGDLLSDTWTSGDTEVRVCNQKLRSETYDEFQSRHNKMVDEAMEQYLPSPIVPDRSWPIGVPADEPDGIATLLQ